MSQASYHADAERQTQLTQGFLQDVEQLARSARGGQWPRIGHIEGVDRTATVHFTVDDDGTFAAVYLEPDWWRALGVAGLSRGLMEAQRNAREKLAAARLLFEHLLGSPERGETESFEWRHRLNDTADMGELISSWRAMTAESYQRMYEYERRYGEAGEAKPEVVSGPDGLVRITMVQGLITDVTVAAWRISERVTDRLIVDIEAALRQAGEKRNG